MNKSLPCEFEIGDKLDKKMEGYTGTSKIMITKIWKRKRVAEVVDLSYGHSGDKSLYSFDELIKIRGES